jgi:hypothetical protein
MLLMTTTSISLRLAPPDPINFLFFFGSHHAFGSADCASAANTGLSQV